MKGFQYNAASGQITVGAGNTVRARGRRRRSGLVLFAPREY
jgi:hypothetical protein